MAKSGANRKLMKHLYWAATALIISALFIYLMRSRINMDSGPIKVYVTDKDGPRKRTVGFLPVDSAGQRAVADLLGRNARVWWPSFISYAPEILILMPDSSTVEFHGIYVDITYMSKGGTPVEVHASITDDEYLQVKRAVIKSMVDSKVLR